VLVFGGVIGVIFGERGDLLLSGALTGVRRRGRACGSCGGATVAYVAMQERRLRMPWGWTMAFAVVGIFAGYWRSCFRILRSSV
jgi:hypothetical protein